VTIDLEAKGATIVKLQEQLARYLFERGTSNIEDELYYHLSKSSPLAINLILWVDAVRSSNLKMQTLNLPIDRSS
jgi:hypothetical protein